jgi:DNA-binding HxlR family transcriptional regulator
MISKGLKELETAGWIKRKKRFSSSTIYKFNFAETELGPDESEIPF